MTTPMVDTVRTIPLIIESPIPFEYDDESGFPFDRDADRETRDASFRSRLDDLAKRHPEFADAFTEEFPDTDNLRSWMQDRPSGRFERYGFPFSRDPFDEAAPQPSQPTPPPPQPETEPAPEQAEAPPRGRKNIQQSNTCDLGQKQEPEGERNQRSMSAPPPDSRAGEKRFVSSVNIPIGGMGDMGGQQSQPQEKPNKPMERVIPIHVEGRDEPVIPKHAGPSFSQTPPQPERIFGQRPGQFTQFVGPHKQERHNEPPAPPTDQQQQQQQQYQQQQQQKFQEQQKEAPAAPKSTNNPIDIIQAIQKDVSALMGQVEKFSGAPRDKQYRYLDEMLTRNLLKLDNIDTQGQENIRQARKEAIKCIEKCIGVLEAKAEANVAKPEEAVEKMEVEVKAEEVAAADVEVKEAAPVVVVEPVKVEEVEKMETEVKEAPQAEPVGEKPKEETQEVSESGENIEKEAAPAVDEKKKKKKSDKK